MTPAEIGALTISEVEAIVVRATEALTKFREAQAMLGGVAQSAAQTEAPVDHAHARFANPNAARGVSANGIQWTPAELAEKERLRNQFTPPPEGI